MKMTKYRTIHEIKALIEKGETTYEEVMGAYINRIDQVEGTVDSFLQVLKEEALNQAKAADENKDDKTSPLFGIPYGLKDNICMEGVETTCASKILTGFIPPYSATVAEDLKNSGAVVLGKANMDEFAMGSSNENSSIKPTKNPWDPSRVPGGSSGGSAACVAADEVVFALGSDTGGSIRQPASFCGVVGLKPTYGLVSRYGLIAFASSLDQIGPITKDVTDCALVLNQIAGHDEKDSTSVDREKEDYTSYLQKDIKGMKIGIVEEYFGEGLQPDVRKRLEEAVEVYKSLGAQLVDVKLPTSDYALSAYYIISSAEASSNLARYDGIRYGFRAEGFDDLLDLYKKTRSQGFGEEVKRRIMLGTYALSSGYYDAYYKKALQVRTLIKEDFDKALSQCDVILSPTCPTTAFKLGEKSSDPLEMYLSDIYTVPVNIAGIPAISIPCGLDEQGLPVGMQLIGRDFGEKDILKAAYAFEQATKHHLNRPTLQEAR
ncbi:Asp-tRNA(Asn)/Glu-tRNA(Gln) amidotransferase subunit GatA [Alkalibacter rhizosphaerae]|uniref:Glutamyl-tRNA(Gln) amidotransferase subunit A n=1 Tax=Alkalibacter rhizosphaerae TaxID=2815577 RepID=A0A975AH46_9FIRM|nr:Asp-tRNA(Asn)/Glu-tRNA(Gln) amidotransferase subunit GatA [Alkalibacter rhizosphaerae]QSX08062.1 Asp-tRNA(Asn)/Glu-tRNA(Gln) amidotransferase subunit GatA [Alkalibacter rhizosphaerae]